MVDVRHFDAMFEANPLALLLVDKQLNNVKTNAEFVSITGIPREKVLSIKLTDFKDMGLIKYLKDSGETFQDAITKKRAVHGQSSLEVPAGRIEVLRTIVPLFDEKGELEYVFISYNDLTKMIKVANYMANEVEELSRIYAIMAQGDLTPRYQLSDPDEDTKESYDLLVKLRDGVRGIIGSLQVNIRDVNKKMQDLTLTSEKATRSVEEASRTVNLIARNAGVVSGNAQKSAEAIDQISKAMQDMSASVEEITSSMESVSSQANNANTSAKSGAVLAETVSKDMEEMSAGTNEVYNLVKDIEKQMTDISRIIGLIRDIANQTNLLALNAAIEAARAGDHGRGFAVVAAEVKSLAQDSRSSAEKIEDMITQLNNATMKATGAMEAAKGLVGKGVAESQQALYAFREIQKAAETVANSASDVAAASEEQAATTEEITASVHEVASLIDATAKEAGEAAAGTEESAASIDEIAGMIQNVNEVAAAAMEANRKFKVE